MFIDDSSGETIVYYTRFHTEADFIKQKLNFLGDLSPTSSVR